MDPAEWRRCGGVANDNSHSRIRCRSIAPVMDNSLTGSPASRCTVAWYTTCGYRSDRDGYRLRHCPRLTRPVLRLQMPKPQTLERDATWFSRPVGERAKQKNAAVLQKNKKNTVTFDLKSPHEFRQ